MRAPRPGPGQTLKFIVILFLTYFSISYSDIINYHRYNIIFLSVYRSFGVSRHLRAFRIADEYHTTIRFMRLAVVTRTS